MVARHVALVLDRKRLYRAADIDDRFGVDGVTHSHVGNHRRLAIRGHRHIPRKRRHGGYVKLSRREAEATLQREVERHVAWVAKAQVHGAARPQNLRIDDLEGASSVRPGAHAAHAVR
jgi:hypothetical protein